MPKTIKPKGKATVAKETKTVTAVSKKVDLPPAESKSKHIEALEAKIKELENSLQGAQVKITALGEYLTFLRDNVVGGNPTYVGQINNLVKN